MGDLALGRISLEKFQAVEEEVLRETIAQFEETGSPVITGRERTKPSFATHPLSGLKNLAADGAVIAFADGHRRQLPKLTAGPFRYAQYAAKYLTEARRFAKKAPLSRR